MPTIDKHPNQIPTIEEIISALERMLQSLAATGPSPPGGSSVQPKEPPQPQVASSKSRSGFPPEEVPPQIIPTPSPLPGALQRQVSRHKPWKCWKGGWEAHAVNTPSLTPLPTSADPGSPHSRVAWKEPVGGRCRKRSHSILTPDAAT